MKKLSYLQKAWFLRRARRKLAVKKWKSFKENPQSPKLAIRPINLANTSLQRRPHKVSAWVGANVEKIVAECAPIMPPKRLCFLEDLPQTLQFLSALSDVAIKMSTPGVSQRNKRTWFVNRRTKKGPRRIRSYFDFAAIEYLSTSAALAITAEYDVARTYLADPPPTINLEKWNPEVLWTLSQMGFFEALGIVPKSDEFSHLSADKRVLRIVKGTNGNSLQSIAAEIAELVSFWGGGELNDEVKLNLNTAIGEAMINVAKWAYPAPKGGFDPRLRSYWITGSVDKRSRSLEIAIYDRGLSIPKTYSDQPLPQSVLDFFRNAIKPIDNHEFANDASYIEAAVKYGASSSGQGNRGKGLPQMKETIEKTMNGSLMIASRGGLYHLQSDGTLRAESSRLTLRGTVVEWRLSLQDVLKT